MLFNDANLIVLNNNHVELKFFLLKLKFCLKSKCDN